MKHMALFRTGALMMALVLTLALAACGSQSDSQGGSSGKLDAPPAQNTESTPPESTPGGEEPENTPDADRPEAPAEPDGQPEPHVYSDAAQAALDGLYMNYGHERFAASYLGYREEGDTSSLSAWMYDNNPTQASFWPFLLEIPGEDIIGEYGDVYCVVPMDGNLTFTVKSVEWETEGNGSTPHYSDPVYYAQIDRPFLLYITHTQWWDETNLTVEFVEPSGFVGTWCPTYDPETGNLYAHSEGNILDFAALYEIGDYVPHLGNNDPAPDSEWLPPTNLGLGNTTWYSDNGWVLEFSYMEGDETGYMVLYQPVEDGDGMTLTPYYDGTWWMEDDSLCLGVYDGNCPFPLLISPSGEQMVIMQADDGSVLPFFREGQSIVSLTLSYG